jgi:Cof subfamily protein (haloacid dehalogenase superfamily)
VVKEGSPEDFNMLNEIKLDKRNFMMEYKLVVLDVDGTLLNEDKKITPRTKTALLKIQQLGVHIVLASGRPTYGVTPLARELALDKNGGYILSYNGGQIINMQTHELLFEKRVNPEMLPYLEQKARKNEFPIFTYHQDTILTTHPENERILKEAELNGMQVKGVAEFANAVDFWPCKCMLVSEDGDALTELETHWKRRLAGSLDVFRSEDYFLEIVPQDIDKANTLSWLMEKLGIEAKDVIAIGDGVCDVTMIQLAGLGVAMGNAQDSVKACADYITDSNEGDGVAAVVEKYILSAIHPSTVPLEQLNVQGRHALMGNLGIQYTYASENRVEATMPVDHRTRQPFGILHGGATLALAETVAGLGSFILCRPDEMMAGMQISGNHMSSAHEGDTVRAVATILHKGRSSHVWNVDIFTSTDKLISSIRVLNSIMKKR